MELKQSVRTLMLGGQGSGKSTLGRAMYMRHYLLPDARDRYYVLDINDTHFSGNAVVPGLDRYGFVKIPLNEKYLSSVAQRNNIPDDPLTVIQHMNWDAVVQTHDKAVFVFELIGEELEAAIQAVSRAIRNAENAALLVDEATTFLPTGQRKSNEFFKLLTAGRNRGIDYILITQHANFANVLLKQVANTWFTSRTMNSNDIDALKRGIFGEHAEKVQSLGHYEWLVMSELEPIPEPHIIQAKYFTR